MTAPAGGVPLASRSPFGNWDLPRLLREQSRRRSGHPFLVWVPFHGEPHTWTYAAFSRDVRSVAAGLAKRGVAPGDHVLVHLENSPEFLVTWFACAEVGAVAVTTNIRSAGPELEYYAAHSGAVGAVTQPSLADLVSSHCPDLRWIVVTTTNGGEPPSASELPGGSDSFESLLDTEDEPLAGADDPLRPMAVQFTSGTTSRPKGVIWTHANTLWAASVGAAHETLRPDDIHLTYLPLFHTNALSFSLLPTLWVGATMVLQPRFSASRFWDVSLRYGCTWSSMIPFVQKALLNVDRPPHHGYRLWGNAECATPHDEHFGVKTIGWWGMTETVTQGTLGDAHADNVPGSIGRPAPEYRLELLDQDDQPVHVGEVGRLAITGVPGVSLFGGYLADPDATRASFDAAGRFRTGDLAREVDGGFYEFVNREKDMIRVGGENVAASEVERVILGVAGVDEAAVVAKPHGMLNEVTVAFVTADERTEDLPARVIAACRDNLADFKVPAEVHVVESLPRSTIEKVAKAELRARLRDASP